MRLTFKLTAGTLIVVAILLSIDVWFRVHREAETLLTEMKKDHLMVSRALRVDVIDQWYDGGQPAAFQLIQRINDERAFVNITAWHVNDVPDDIAFTLNEGREVQRIEERDGGEALVTWSPIAPRGRLLASLQLEESLASVNSYVMTTLKRTAGTALVGLLATSVVAWLFGFFAVGRPMQALVAKARRVAAGDLEGDVNLGRNDELALLAHELNTMSRSLKDARRAVQEEAEGRIEAIEQLRHADRLSTVGTLAAGIAHELGTPLNVVLARAQMIEAGAADAVRQGTIIKEQTQRIVRIVRQLLDFARAERPVADDIDLRELASVAVEFLAPIGHEKAVTLTLDVGGAVFAHADGMQIRQVLTNLIVNGIQASPRGSSVVVSAGRVKETHQVSLDVTDSGPGVSDEVRGRLFQPFFTTKPPGEGTGLGLAVAWGIIRENGGTIVVEPAVVGEGAHFRILLPAATGSPASNDTPERHDTHETHGEAVL